MLVTTGAWRVKKYAVSNGICGSRPESVTIQMKATEQYFPVVLFIMLYKVILTFESVDEILKCDHSNESYFPVVLFIILFKAVPTFRSVDEITQYQ